MQRPGKAAWDSWRAENFLEKFRASLLKFKRLPRWTEPYLTTKPQSK